MTTLRPAPLAFALALAFSTSLANAQNLLEMVQAAQRYDANYLSAKLSADAAALRVEQARSGTRPSAAMSAGASIGHTTLIPGQNRGQNSQNVGVQGSYGLWKPQVPLNISQAERAAEIAKTALVSADQEVMVRVSQAYFDVLAALDTLTFVKAQKAAVAEQLAAAKRNFEVGTSTVTDQREAQARFDLVGAQEIAAENDLSVKSALLDQLVGKPKLQPKGLLAGAKLPGVDQNDEQSWVAQAESNHPAVRQGMIAVDIAQLETAKARASEKPTVDLVANYGINRSDPTGSGVFSPTTRSNSGSIGVQFSMPLYTGGATQNRIKETLVLEDKARADLDNAKRQVASATRTAYFGVRSGIGQVKALEAAEISSQSALDANRLGYQVGVRINIDVLNSQSQLFQTKRDLARARYDVLVGGLRLRQANGTLQLADVQTVNALLAK
jgi:outer membrane protein